MPKLLLSLDGLLLKEIPLNKERTTIGRKPHNDIQIDNLAISGEHAVILTLGNDSFLEDINSTNGTVVNGAAITKHYLQSGDIIELGKYHLKYHSDVPGSRNAEDFERTMGNRPDLIKKTQDQVANKRFGDTQTGLPGFDLGDAAKDAASEAAAATGAVAPATLPKAAIQVLTGGSAGRELELTKTLTSLGKPGVQVAVIARRPHGYFITHVEGKTFPSVSGQVLEPNKPHPLEDHDVIDLGGVKMEFFFKD